jgi:hypothetical protein
MRNIVRIAFIFCVSIVSLITNAQDKDRFFNVMGKVDIKDIKAEGVRIVIYNEADGSIAEEGNTSSSGRFRFKLAFQKDYRMEFTKDGYYNKIVLVSTVVSVNVLTKDSYFPPFIFGVLMVKRIPDVEIESDTKPVGRIFYSSQMDNFEDESYISDSQIQEEIDDAVAEIVEEKYIEKINEAGDLEKKGDLAGAKEIYLAAGEIKKGDKFIKDKIKELNTEIKLQEEEARALAESKEKTGQLEAAFNKLITEGNQNITVSKLKEALASFTQALGLNFNNELAQQNIDSVNELIRQKQEEESRLASLAEEKAARLTSLAEEKEARLAALAKEKAHQEAEFNKLITEGDQNVTASKLQEALTSYTQALNLITKNEQAQQKLVKYSDALNLALNRELAQQKIDFVKELMRKKQEEEVSLAAQAAEKDILETEFNKLIIEGDQNIEINKLQKALVSYTKALNLNFNNTLAQQKINTVRELMRQKQEEEKVIATANKTESNIKLTNLSAVEIDDIYKQIIAVADQNYKKSEWTVAKSHYFDALGYKPKEAYPKGQIELCIKAIESDLSEELLKQYTENIKNADIEMEKERYSRARFYYYKALDIKSWEKYPREQLNKIDNIFDNNLSASQKAEYEKMISKADKSLNEREYSVARFYYQSAIKIKENQYPASKLNEIKKILEDMQSGKMEAIFDEHIKKADEAVQKNNPSIAKFYYRKALSVDPTATHPQEQLKKLESNN